MIWDRSCTHRSKRVQKYLQEHPEVHIKFLPAYAPELNPEAFCHGNVKRHVKNAVFLSVKEIRISSDARFARLSKRPDILHGCFHHTNSNLTNFGERQ